jgi:hypothetical protein
MKHLVVCLLIFSFSQRSQLELRYDQNMNGHTLIERRDEEKWRRSSLALRYVTAVLMYIAQLPDHEPKERRDRRQLSIRETEVDRRKKCSSEMREVHAKANTPEGSELVFCTVGCAPT